MSCTGKQCGFNINTTRQEAGCSAGSGSCFEAKILSAAETKFHDQTLMSATADIQRILSEITPDPNGRKLSFINTNMGLLLAWVEHGRPVPPGAVTDRHTDTAIAAALKLRSPY
jgi:hypothetical protein